MYKPKRKFDFYVFRILLIFLFIAFWRLNLYGQEAIEATSEELVDQSEPWWVWVFLGRLHPLMVHFPIGLLVIAGIMELAKLRTFDSKLRTGTNWLVYIGAAGSVLAVLLGLLLANSGSYSGETF